MVERRVGQEDAEQRDSRSDLRAQDRGRVGAPRYEHDGALGRREQLRVRLADLGDLPRGVEIPQHDGEGLRIAPLARAQSTHRRGGGRIDCEVIAAQTLDGDDETLPERFRRARERAGRGDFVAPGVQEPQPGPAGRARVGLRVEAPVHRIFVLASAVRAELEARHRGADAVVGYVGRDREARAAARAVGEGIAVAAVARIEDLAQARVAGAEVGGIDTRRSSASALAEMTKPRVDRASIACERTSRTWAAGGAESRSRRQKDFRTGGGPKASIVTPVESLRTNPRTPSS